MISRKVVFYLVAGLLALAPLVANAQTVTGSLTGTVVDSADAVVAGAVVRLTNSSGQSREFNTGTNGGFEFTGLIPGVYNVKVTQAGFNTYSQQNVTVSAQERVDLHTIRLTVGDVATSIEVQAEGAH